MAVRRRLRGQRQRGDPSSARAAGAAWAVSVRRVRVLSGGGGTRITTRLEPHVLAKRDAVADSTRRGRRCFCQRLVARFHQLASDDGQLAFRSLRQCHSLAASRPRKRDLPSPRSRPAIARLDMSADDRRSDRSNRWPTSRVGMRSNALHEPPWLAARAHGASCREHPVLGISSDRLRASPGFMRRYDFRLPIAVICLPHGCRLREVDRSQQRVGMSSWT